MEFVGFAIDPVDMDISMNCEKPNCILKSKLFLTNQIRNYLGLILDQSFPFFPSIKWKKKKFAIK